MKVTFQHRQEVVHDPQKTTDVFKILPRLLDVQGLLNQDFVLLFGAETASKMLEKWDTAFMPKNSATKIYLCCDNSHEDMKKYGFGPILQLLINDIKTLESHGLDYPSRLKKSVERIEGEEASTYWPKVGRQGHKCPICGLLCADLMQHMKLGEKMVKKAAIEEGIRRKFEDPSSVPPDSQVEAPSSAEPSDTYSASVTPLNKR
ncbi:hypothetical protein FQN60_010526 [Etheostoma spectabile]|uniref:Uncharacterized protein n=1 Tax=Etheostoma spectabile TaxID=54343 RepID=A0A5J5DBL8_9PERO|nr:hypothetical protein FQN60_010526 [Etheostoma spectabile]